MESLLKIVLQSSDGLVMNRVWHEITGSVAPCTVELPACTSLRGDAISKDYSIIWNRSVLQSTVMG